jgi:hypothetical protein
MIAPSSSMLFVYLRLVLLSGLFSTLSLFSKKKDHETILLSVCLCTSSITFWKPKQIFKTLCMCIMATESISPRPVSLWVSVSPVLVYAKWKRWSEGSQRPSDSEIQESRDIRNQKSLCWWRPAWTYWIRMNWTMYPLWLLGNGSVNMFPRLRRIVGDIFSYALYTPKENCWVVLVGILYFSCS